MDGGNVCADWHDWERAPGTTCAEVCGIACDHYNRYPDDLALLGDLGFGAYRFSIEWSRVEQREGEAAPDEIAHYAAVAVECRRLGLEPVVTFNHFTLPRWAAERGGWEDPSLPASFARFCGWMCDALAPLLRWAVTLNEPNIVALLGYEDALFPPARRDREARVRVTEAFVDAHLRARDVVRERTDAQVGLALAMADWQATPGGEGPLDEIRSLREDVYLKAAAGDDFVGVNTYTRHRVGPEGFLAPEEGVERTGMGYEFWPDALAATVRRAWDVTGLPVLVTENGIATSDDSRRVAFVDGALRGLHRCIESGIDVRGYFYWTLMDNYEWNYGYGPAFGLVEVDRETLERRPRPSARWLGEVARTGVVPS